MAATITTYTGLSSAFLTWMAREGDTDLAGRFDDFMALAEARIYYGKEAMPSLGIPAHEAVRCAYMEAVDTSFAISNGVAQPTGFLALKSATLNSPLSPMDVVEESIIDAYRDQALGYPRLIAVSGTTFRFKDDPGSGTYTATLRYYKKLTTPTASASNDLLTNAPGLYLNAILLEAAIMSGDAESAKGYAALYAAEAAGLNRHANRVLAHAHNLRMRIRGRTP